MPVTRYPQRVVISSLCPGSHVIHNCRASSTYLFGPTYNFVVLAVIIAVAQHYEMTKSTVGHDKVPDGDSTSEKLDEYVLDKIIDHDEIDGKIYYRHCWYEYPTKDDTTEHEEHLPQHFIERIRQHLNHHYKKMKTSTPLWTRKRRIHRRL